VTKPEEPKEAEHVVLEDVPISTSDGWNLLQKAVFFGVIAGVVAIYFKIRSRGDDPVEKFPA